ncbi:MAG: antibiotic biosynthesis monooxygenase [Candidatus Thiodiazotropha sp. (ex Myrtea sp. 'scaly one' KF741663)]|nr:antibiotic biosynthesis monooxygenase [Candidatus Thiodiazotropha sp. (ex Myrtea sp. 'scaly one' KF741663)]
MYAVIFKAQIKQLDETYRQTAAQLRELAEKQYGCREFVSITQDAHEIAISYWDSLAQIQTWKEDAVHLAAQVKSPAWYKSIQIQIVEVVREYDRTY